MGMNQPSVDPSAVADALGRVLAVEGIAILGDAGRLRALLMDELGSEGRRHRTAVDALTGLSADVGGRLVQTPPDRARPLLDGWATTQRSVEPAPARWAAGVVSTAVGAGPTTPRRAEGEQPTGQAPVMRWRDPRSRASTVLLASAATLLLGSLFVPWLTLRGTFTSALPATTFAPHRAQNGIELVATSQEPADRYPASELYEAPSPLNSLDAVQSWAFLACGLGSLVVTALSLVRPVRWRWAVAFALLTGATTVATWSEMIEHEGKLFTSLTDFEGQLVLQPGAGLWLALAGVGALFAAAAAHAGHTCADRPMA